MSDVWKKLQVKERKSWLVINAPEAFREVLKETPADTLDDMPEKQAYEVILSFVKTEEEIAEAALLAEERLAEGGIFWVMYPKKSSKKYSTEISRDQGWSSMEKKEFKAVRQIAIDEDWSALRFRPASEWK
ncbi:DUF3052 family protein [Bacillus daqingensis]|uniref:DUF3052 family protein n=1 Tax=Bacillus daqingensis TaxID=872396 RepID=A0ABV9NRE8_9BACI